MFTYNFFSFSHIFLILRGFFIFFRKKKQLSAAFLLYEVNILTICMAK